MCTRRRRIARRMASDTILAHRSVILSSGVSFIGGTTGGVGSLIVSPSVGGARISSRDTTSEAVARFETERCSIHLAVFTRRVG